MEKAERWTTDDFLGGRLKIRQPAHGYRAGSDALLLAAAVPAKAGDIILDVGAGVGTAGLCLLSRIQQTSIIGLELQHDLVEAALENVAANGFESRCQIVSGDISDRKSFASEHQSLISASYDHVIANPPYYADGRAQKSPNKIKSIAHVEQQGDLSSWVKFCLARTKPKGTVTLINRSDRLGEMLRELENGAGNIRIIPLWPAAGKPAKRVLVQAIKGSRSPLTLEPGIVLHNNDGTPTTTADAIARDGLGLDNVL